jgi:hypothetical protein
MDTSSDKKPLMTEGTLGSWGKGLLALVVFAGFIVAILMLMKASEGAGAGPGPGPDGDKTSARFYKNCNYDQNVNDGQNYYDKIEGPEQMNINIQSFRIRNCKITLYEGKNCTGKEKTFEANLTNNNGYIDEPCFTLFIVQSIKIEPIPKPK